MPRTRAIIVVSIAQRDAANAAARKIDPVGGEKTFTAAYSRTSVAEFYVCNWQFEGDELARFKQALRDAGIAAVIKIREMDDSDPSRGKPNMEDVRASDGIRPFVG